VVKSRDGFAEVRASRHEEELSRGRGAVDRYGWIFEPLEQRIANATSDGPRR
jgi:hypothetical protein